MTLSNQDLLQRLDQSLKAITDVSQLSDSVLAPEKFDQFVRRMEDSTVVLPDARMIEMDSHTTEIDRTSFTERILRSGKKGGDRQTLGTDDFAAPKTWTNKLVVEEFQAVTSLSDPALRRNIEREDFTNTLIDLFGEAAGRDLEELAIFGDTEIDENTDEVLAQIDGWAKLCENVLWQDDISGDSDPEKAYNTLDGLLEALPKRYLGDPSEWRFYVDWELLNDYRKHLRDRETDLGDRAYAEGMTSPTFAGIPVVYVPLLSRAKDADNSYVSGRIAMLQHPDNMAWGIFHEVTVEDEREAKSRRTDFVLTVEADAHYEDEEAGVVAFLEREDV